MGDIRRPAISTTRIDGMDYCTPTPFGTPRSGESNGRMPGADRLLCPRQRVKKLDFEAKHPSPPFLPLIVAAFRAFSGRRALAPEDEECGRTETKQSSLEKTAVTQRALKRCNLALVPVGTGTVLPSQLRCMVNGLELITKAASSDPPLDWHP